MCCNFSHEKASGRRGDFIARWYRRNKWCWIKRHICLANGNDHLLHSYDDSLVIS
jgi:hypothetical protein